MVMSGAKTWGHAAKLAGKLRIIKLCVKGDPAGIRAIQFAVVYGVHSQGEEKERHVQIISGAPCSESPCIVQAALSQVEFQGAFSLLLE